MFVVLLALLSKYFLKETLQNILFVFLSYPDLIFISVKMILWYGNHRTLEKRE